MDNSEHTGGRDNPIAILLDDGDATTVTTSGGKDNPIVLDHDDACSLSDKEVEEILDGIGEKAAADEEILNQVKDRGYRVAEFMTDEEVVKMATERGIHLLADARPTRLIHELHRQHLDLSLDAYYGRGWGNVPTGCDLLIPSSGASKLSVEQKKFATVRHFAPRGVYDFDVDMTDNLDQTGHTDNGLVGNEIDLAIEAKGDDVSFFTDIN